MSKSIREQLAKRLKENQERNESFGGGLLFKDDEAKKRIWKCGEGKHIIDILPYEAGRFDPSAAEGDLQYVYEYYFHANLGLEGKNQVMCLSKTYGKPCPICEDIQRMKKEGEDEEVIKALAVKRNPKSIYNILCWDKGEDKKGVQLFIVSHWFMGKHLLELATIPLRDGQEEIDPIIPFMDPDDGKSVYFRREGTGANDTRYYGHQLLDRPKGFKISKKDLDDCFCLDEIIKIPTYEEVLEIYNSTKGESKDESSSRRKHEEDDRPSRRRSIEDDDDKSSRRKHEEDDEPVRKSKKEEKSSRKDMDDERDIPSDQCEFGHKFGYDANKFPDDCDECGCWKECVKKARKLKEEKEESFSKKSDDEPVPKKRKHVDEDEDKPAKKKEVKREEEEEDDRPSRRRREIEDDDDDRPVRKKEVKREEDDDEPPVTRRKSADDDDDDRPARRSRR